MLGHVFHCFWVSNLLSVWNADHMYEGNVEDMFYNVMLAYYLACSNVAMLTEQHGPNDWPRFFIPERTFVNAMATTGQFVGRCLHWPQDIPFMPRKTRERICEIFFAWIKQHCKGTPREKDLIYGLRAPFNGQPSKAHSKSVFRDFPSPSQSIPRHSQPFKVFTDIPPGLTFVAIRIHNTT